MVTKKIGLFLWITNCFWASISLDNFQGRHIGRPWICREDLLDVILIRKSTCPFGLLWKRMIQNWKKVCTLLKIVRAKDGIRNQFCRCKDQKPITLFSWKLCQKTFYHQCNIALEILLKKYWITPPLRAFRNEVSGVMLPWYVSFE